MPLLCNYSGHDFNEGKIHTNLELVEKQLLSPFIIRSIVKVAQAETIIHWSNIMVANIFLISQPNPKESPELISSYWLDLRNTLRSYYRQRACNITVF